MNARKRGLLAKVALIALVFAAGACIGVGGLAVAPGRVRKGPRSSSPPAREVGRRLAPGRGRERADRA